MFTYKDAKRVIKFAESLEKFNAYATIGLHISDKEEQKVIDRIKGEYNLEETLITTTGTTYITYKGCTFFKQNY